jgi:hypothetical protein
MKFIVKIFLLLSVFSLSECRTMSWGNLQARNLQMFDQLIHEKPSAIESGESDEKIYKDLEFSSKHSELITAIHITDLTWFEDGGIVKIISGGIGFTFVKLQLISEPQKQILLNIEIFGR